MFVRQKRLMLFWLDLSLKRRKLCFGNFSHYKNQNKMLYSLRIGFTTYRINPIKKTNLHIVTVRRSFNGVIAMLEIKWRCTRTAFLNEYRIHASLQTRTPEISTLKSTLERIKSLSFSNEAIEAKIAHRSEYFSDWKARMSQWNGRSSLAPVTGMNYS